MPSSAFLQPSVQTALHTEMQSLSSSSVSRSGSAWQQHHHRQQQRVVTARRRCASASRRCQLRTPQHVTLLRAVPPSADSKPVQPEEGDFEGLLPEEDYEVPGNYLDALTSSTKLGKAVKSAVEELEHLGNLEAEVLQECDGLLKQLGMKGSLFGSSGDNPLLRLQQELQQQQELEEQQALEQQQQESQQQSQQQQQQK